MVQPTNENVGDRSVLLGSRWYQLLYGVLSMTKFASEVAYDGVMANAIAMLDTLPMDQQDRFRKWFPNFATVNYEDLCSAHDLIGRTVTNNQRVSTDGN